MTEKNYLVLAFYHFVTLEEPLNEVELHKSFFKDRDITSRIYISEEGINGQMSATRADAHAYMEWMHSRNPFSTVHFKIHEYHEQVFPRQTVKYRKQLVALDQKVDMNKTGTHVSPKEWKEMLENNENRVVLDVRNDYEWKIGHFDGADLPPCENFREFDQYAEQLKTKVDPQKTPVMMYCTGGIRCELYSVILRERGFENVYQLNGGIINYGLEEGSAHWLGKLFVFDDRLSIPISNEETPVIGQCHHCQKPNDSYYNCASMDCNTLFLCCSECLPSHKGCCSPQCQESSRLRPFQQLNPHKPFRRAHHYRKNPAALEGQECGVESHQKQQ